MHSPRYRFGFLLNTNSGNMTRYLNLRKYAEQDEEIDCAWATVAHRAPAGLRSPLRLLPEPLFTRARVMQQAMPVLGQLHRFDAVMLHAFEADIVCALRSYVSRRPLRVLSTDDAPLADGRAYPLYPNDVGKSALRRRMRMALDRWRIRRTDHFIPFSRWVADALVECGAPPERVHPLHVGLDLDLWQSAPRPAAPDRGTVRILFVGADFERKGGPLLLEVFKARLRGRAELHLVTPQAPAALPPGVRLHADFAPNDPRLVRLYAAADMLVVPSSADTGPLWVFMEAMAMRLPIIGTDTGANTELLRHGETGLVVNIGDGEQLAAAIDTLASDPARRRAMGERGRRLMETHYSARVNVPRILRTMKDAVDGRVR